MNEKQKKAFNVFVNAGMLFAFQLTEILFLKNSAILMEKLREDRGKFPSLKNVIDLAIDFKNNYRDYLLKEKTS